MKTVTPFDPSEANDVTADSSKATDVTTDPSKATDVTAEVYRTQTPIRHCRTTVGQNIQLLWEQIRQTFTSS